MTTAACLAVVLLAGVAGFFAASLLAPGESWPLRLAWGWALGQVTVSLAAGLCLLLGLAPVFALGAPAVLAVLAWTRKTRGLTRGRRVETGPSPDPASKTGGDKGLRAVALVAGLVALVAAWSTPGLGWDGLAIWGLKARIVAETGTLPLETLRHPSSLPSHPEYPLHTPLLAGVAGDLAIRLGGAWQDHVLPLFAAFDLAALALLLAGLFEQRGRGWTRRVLLAGGLLTPLVWRQLPEGLADLTLAFCLAAAAGALVRWHRGAAGAEAGGGVLILAGVAAGAGAFVKQEGLFWLVILGASAAFFAPAGRRRELLRPGMIALALAAPWHVFRLLVGLGTEPFALAPESLGRLPQVVTATALELADVGRWGLLWFGVWLALVVLDWRILEGRAAPSRTRSGASRGDLVVAGALVAGLLTVVAIFVATPHDVTWHLETALSRLLLQWWAVGLLVIEAGLHALERRFGATSDR